MVHETWVNADRLVNGNNSYGDKGVDLKLYITDSSGSMHYVYVPGGGKFNAYDWSKKNYGWIFKNCTGPVCTNCAYVQCKG